MPTTSKLSIAADVTEGGIDMTKLEPIHPGEILKCDFMDPLSLSAESLSKETGVPSGRIEEIARGSSRISDDTARRFSEYFKTDAQFWVNLQNYYDCEIAEWKKSNPNTDGFFIGVFIAATWRHFLNLVIHPVARIKRNARRRTENN